MDSSLAVVPNANVIMKDELSGVLRRTVSNAEGYFTVAAVRTGTYTVTIEAQGFKKWERTGIVFNPGDKRHISDIVLEVGPTATEVTVTAAAVTLAPVDSGEKSAVITARQIQNISVVGRSAAELIKILPGMSPTGSGIENKPGFSGEVIGINGNGEGGRQSALSYYSANGTRGNAMDIVSDGAHVSDPGCNCATPVNPNPDMIQEFKVLQSNYSAEHAKGPVVLNTVTKSGGRDFHGEGYFYMRQWGWNSNEPQLTAAGQPKVKNKYRFPGGNIGGPVLLPGSDFNRNRDKMFFFTGFEYYVQTLDTGILRSIVPTQAMRDGDFSDSAYLAKLGSGQVNPVPTGPGIVDGVVPENLFDPGGQILMNLIPLPNIDPDLGQGNNYVKALPIDQNSWQWMSRVDYSISDNTKLFVRYNLQRELQKFPVGLWWRNPSQIPYPTDVLGKNISHSASVSLTNVFNPTLTNEVIFGLTYINFPNSFEDPKKVSISALGYPYQGIYKWGNDQVPNFTTWGGAATMYQPGGFDPVLFAKKWLVSVGDNLTKVAGTHTLKFGAFWEIVTNAQPGSDSYGTYDYGALWATGVGQTGNAYANMLTGWANGYSEANKNPVLNMGFRTLEFYVQDSWKATRRLTLELGARFAHLGAWYDREGFGYPIFDESKYSDDPAEVANLTGVVWNKIDSNIPRSGAKTRPLFVVPRVGAAYDLFGTGKTVLRGGFGMFRYHDAQLNSGALATSAGHRSTSFGGANWLREADNYIPQYTRSDVSLMDPNDDQQPVNYNWNVTVSQRLPAQIMWEISYVGNESRNLTNDDHADINPVPWGALLSLPDPDSGSADDFRPRHNYLNMYVTTHTFYQNYHALQTTVQRQTGRINWSANYTWSKTMGIRGGGQGRFADRLDFKHDYGPVSYDRTHMFNLSYVLQVPDLAKNVTGSGGGVLRALVDGWQFSGISQYASGPPIQAEAPDVAMYFRGYIPGTSTAMSQRNWLGTTAVTLMPVVTCDPRSGLQEHQYMNGDCFGVPTTRGQNGDYIFPYMRGPAYVNNDLSVFKTWTLKEEKKLQFRFSAYNFLNHPLWTFTNNDPNLRLELDENGKLQRSRFGYTDNKVGRRVLQLALKFFF